MPTYKSDFLDIMTARGFIHQCSDFAGLDALAAKREVVAYVGYDCTAPSLHVGSLISIMMMHWLQQTGNKPIALMGGGTTRVGDPSGKDETRAIRPIEEIEANKDGIKGVFAKVLDFAAPALAERAQVPGTITPRPRPRSWPTTRSGWRRSTTSSSCAMSAATSRSTAC